MEMGNVPMRQQPDHRAYSYFGFTFMITKACTTGNQWQLQNHIAVSKYRISRSFLVVPNFVSNKKKSTLDELKLDKSKFE